jgi:hypothetical protein
MQNNHMQNTKYQINPPARRVDKASRMRLPCPNGCPSSPTDGFLKWFKWANDLFVKTTLQPKLYTCAYTNIDHLYD